jgi:two-component system response regulator AtoC
MIKKILVAEDEDLIRWSICEFLMSYGYAVDMVVNGREVIERLDKFRYDLLITDLKMPEMNGIDLLHRIREKGISMPVIMISAYFNEFAEEETISKGVFRCVTKPFEMEDILSVVREATVASSMH